MAPCQNEGRPEVVVLVEVNPAALMFHGIHDILLAVAFPKDGIHHIENPMVLKDVESSLVYLLHVFQVFLVQTVHSLNILFFHVQEHRDILCWRRAATNPAGLEARVGRLHLRVQNPNSATLTTYATANVGLEGAARAHAEKLPILELLLSNSGAFEEVLVLQVGDRELVALVQSHSAAKYKCIFVSIGPATSRITRMCTHGNSVVKHQAILFMMSKGVVTPS
mmetsp:Transcript_61412/g.146445  ORF Transcript_61412/g.146445 Transcript_61412/m.146445 type:complete len:223 (-) Transcript_61412:734-1402(-)